ncbi:MAG: hypothetical protein AAGI01_19045 [Myxococcota bacterium]
MTWLRWLIVLVALSFLGAAYIPHASLKTWTWPDVMLTSSLALYLAR